MSNMKARVFKSQISVCQLCDFLVIPHSLRPRLTYPSFQRPSRSQRFATTCRTFARKGRSNSENLPNVSRVSRSVATGHNADVFTMPLQAHRQIDIEHEMTEITKRRDKILSSSSIPSEEEVKEALSRCKVVAYALTEPSDNVVGSQDGSAASALLSVDEPSSAKPATKSLIFPPITKKYIDNLSRVAYSILVHPLVFITSDILRLYISLQSRLRKPDTFPQIFSLFSSKPVPEQGSSPIKYINQKPNKASNAVSIAVADQALQTAIENKQLMIAMDIIETSYAKPAFRRAKFVRKGLFPTTGLAIAPIAAYAVASQLSAYQTTMEPVVATNMAFAGILAYVGFTATIGIVAVTTANDQMDRVTWAQGMPLRERWLREEERAAIDRVAGAWGFREKWRRGEEEGEEWDALREWIGQKGMILDRVDLMEGME